MSLNNKKFYILGVPVDNIDRLEIITKISELLDNSESNLMVTPNPEIILKAQKDEELFAILNKANIALPDGFGLVVAGLARGKKIKRCIGADVTLDILSYAEKNNIKVAVFNWRGGLSSKNDIAEALKAKYPNLIFAVEDVEREWNMPYYQNINIFQPQIIFSTLGSPWQEKFIYHAVKKMPYVHLAAAVGGSFDFLTGKAVRSPKILRNMGLEWLWRLIKQPKRIKRIFNATIVFSYKFILAEFIHPLFYRSAVVCLLFKKNSGRYKILLLKRADENNHWQLPQGGRDRQSITEAGLRELSEELNGHNFKPLKTYKNIYKYRFKKNLPAGLRHGSYKGQRLGLLIAEFFGNDEEIKTNWWDNSDWLWADEDAVLNYVHPVRKEATQIILNKFKNFISKNKKL